MSSLLKSSYIYVCIDTIRFLVILGIFQNLISSCDFVVKLEMEGSFIYLLNEGSFTEMEDMIYTQPPQFQSQPPPMSQPQREAPKSKKGKRSKNFLIEEDMLLISAWLNFSMDLVQGNNQTHTSYWNRIWNYYEGNKEGLESDRSATSLCNRWCVINEKVAKFIGFYNQICGRNQSGLTEQDKVDSLFF